jgi:branched-chain amino acid transport system substrate-binding protein
LVASAVAVLAGCGSAHGGAPAAGRASAALAFMGPATGPYAEAGSNMINAVRLAVDQANRRGDLPVKVAVKVFDTQAEPAQAQTLKDRVVGDPAVVGVIGPMTSGESKAAVPTLDQAGVPVITVATNPDLARHGWRMFHRIVANDDVQAAQAARYLARGLHASTVAYVHDGTEYGRGLAELVQADATREGVRPVLFDAIDPRALDYSAAVNKIRAIRPPPSAVFYGGYYAEAGRLVKQLRDAGVAALFVSGDGSRDPAFVNSSGVDAAEGVEVTCPCADPVLSSRPAARAFTADYQARFGPPGEFAGEAFDAAGLFLDAIRHGNTTRTAVADFLAHRTAAYPGVTGDIAFGPTGEIDAAGIAVYVFHHGRLSFKGTTADLVR